MMQDVNFPKAQQDLSRHNVRKCAHIKFDNHWATSVACLASSKQAAGKNKEHMKTEL
jgi:hypothetical protein